MKNFVRGLPIFMVLKFIVPNLSSGLILSTNLVSFLHLLVLFISQ